MQGSLASLAKYLSLEDVSSLSMKMDGCFGCVYPLGIILETAAC